MKMMAAESREGKRSLSTCDDEESGGKRNKKQAPKITGNKDVFCWTCHRPGNVATCSECPRAYHLKCGHLERIPEPSDKWVCPECDMIQRADKMAPSSPAHKRTFSKLLGFVLDRVKRINGVDNFSAPVDTNKWHDYLEYVIQPMDLPKLKSKIDAHKYKSVEGFLADFRWLVHASYVYNSVHSVYTKIAKSMMNVAKQECEEVKNCSECYMHACTLGDEWFIEPCTTPHVLVWAQLSGFPYWPAKVMRQLSGDVVDVRFFGDHTRANVPAASCFLYSRVMPCSVRGKKHSSKITNGIEEAEVYVKSLKSTYNTFCYARYRVNYLPKEDECMRKLQLPEFPIANETPEFLARVETLRKEKMLEDKEFHSEMKRMISEQEKSKRPSLPQKRKSTDSSSKLLEMKRKLVKIDTAQGQKLAIMNMSESESDSSPKHTPFHLKRPMTSSMPAEKSPISAVSPEMNGGHNSNKTPSKVDDETIKQVLARSPKELTPMCDNVSPITTPPKDSGIIESLSRKLFTTPENLVNGRGKSGQLTRSLSQKLSIPKREVSLESDSDSDALVIAEESPPIESSGNYKSPEGSEPISQRSKTISVPESVKLISKTRSSEGKNQLILIRKSYIASENSSPANRVLPAEGNESLPTAKEEMFHKPILQKQNELHKAALLSGTDPPETSPLVPRRTRRSLNIDGISSVVKKDTGLSNEQALQFHPFTSSNDNLPTGMVKPKTLLTSKMSKTPPKEAFESQIDGLLNESEPALSKIRSPSIDDISCTVGVNLRSACGNEKPRLSRGACNLLPEGPNATDNKPAVELTDSPTTAEMSSCPKEVMSLSSDVTASKKPNSDHLQSTSNLHSADGFSSLTKQKGSQNMLASEEPPVDEPTEIDREPDQSATNPAGGISIRELSEKSDQLPTATLPKASTKPDQFSTILPGDVSSPYVEENNSEARIPSMEVCNPNKDSYRKTDDELLINSNLTEVANRGSSSKNYKGLSEDVITGPSTLSVETVLTESAKNLDKDIVTGPSTLSAGAVPTESAKDLLSTKRLPEEVTFDDKNKKPLVKRIPQEDERVSDKDTVTQAAIQANSNEDLSQRLESNVQQITPVKSVICHSTDVSPVQVSSPESSSVTSSPEGGVLVMKAVCKVPASMKVPVIKVVRARVPDEPSKSKVGSSEESSNLVPLEGTLEIDASVTCNDPAAGTVVPNSSETGMHCTLPISAPKGNNNNCSLEASERSGDHTLTEKPEKIIEDSLPGKEAEDRRERLQEISSLDMLNGDLSHLYKDLDPPEEDDESDEPTSRKVTPEGTPSKMDLSVPTDSEADALKKESTLKKYSEDINLTEMDLGKPVQKETEPVLKEVPDSKTTDPQEVPSADISSSVESGAVSPMETGTIEKSQTIHIPPGTDKTVVSDEPTDETNEVNQLATGSSDSKTKPLTSELSIEPLASNLTSQSPVNPDSCSSNSLEKTTELIPSHSAEQKSGKCTCIMCHVAHPGASFDKTVEDFHIMKSIELVEPKRGLSRETEEFLKRLKETDAFAVSSEACEKVRSIAEASRTWNNDGQDFDSVSKNRRRSVNSLVQKPLLMSSLAPRMSTDSLESEPSTTSSKLSRPLPALVTLTKEVVQRRLSSEQKNSQWEKNSGELLISSSMSLNPSHLGQISSSSPADQPNADAKKPSLEKNLAFSSSESLGGNDPKKATQNATTMPLPIVIKPDPDADEIPVPKNQVLPTPPRPTIKLKQMSSLLERPPPPPSPKRPEQSTSNRRDCSTPKFNMVPPFEPKKTLADVRKLIESKSQFISAKLKKDIYTLFDQIQHEYDSHMELLEHIADASLNTVESTLETNKNLVFEEMKIRLRNQVDAHVADVKKKQWCILCGNEAAFHCCWGYNYCCEDCQKNDWAEHTKVCTQYNMTATDPYIRASPRFQALLEKQMLGGSNKKIMIQDLIDSPVAVSVQSSPPGKAKPAPAKGRKILAGPRTSFLESDLSLDPSNMTSLALPALSKTSAVTTNSVQRLNDQPTYKLVQPGRTVRIINPPRPRLPQMVSKPQVAPKAMARPVVSRTPVTSTSGNQRKQISMPGRIVPPQQNSNRSSFLRVMDEVEIASILQRNHLNEY